MTLILDTDALPRADRADALHAAMAAAAVPATTTPQPGEPLRARLEAWPVAADATLMRRRSTGVRIVRTARQARRATAERLALTLLSPGAWRFDQSRAGHASPSAGGTLILVDHTAPYAFDRWGSGTTVALNLDLDALDLPRAVVASAVRRMTPHHPLHAVTTAYLQMLVLHAGAAPAGLDVLRTGTVPLARALVADAGGDRVRARGAHHDSLRARSHAYLALHAADRDLGPEQVARAHHVSVRRLHQAWEGSGTTVRRALVRHRLVLAQQMLRAPTASRLTVAEVSRRAGFADPTHFTHRFTEAYGIPPRAYRTS